MIGKYMELYDMGKTERQFLEKVKSELSTSETFGSILTLNLVLEKLQKQKNENIIQFKIIEDMNKKINSSELYKLVKIVEKINQKPKVMVSILSFSILGFFSTIFVYLVISIIKGDISKNKINDFLKLD